MSKFWDHNDQSSVINFTPKFSKNRIKRQCLSSNHYQFQGNMFHPNVPNYLNFGGIGYVIGHEITHGFDDIGKQFDSSGLLRNWWKPETDKNYKEKSQCIIWQAENYTVKQINMTLNGVSTIGENIADYGGIKEARIAYGNFIIDTAMFKGLLLFAPV